MQDWVQKNLHFYSIVPSPLDKTCETSELFAVASDGCIKQIQQSQLVGCFETVETQGSIAILSSGRAYFTGVSVPGAPGSIRCYRAPLNGEYGKHTCHAGLRRIKGLQLEQPVKLHLRSGIAVVSCCSHCCCLLVPSTLRSCAGGQRRHRGLGPRATGKDQLTEYILSLRADAGPVTRLAVAVQDFILLSAGADGMLCVWNVNDRDRAPLEHSGIEYTAEVLVDRTHLMERQSQLIELERQVEDVTNQMDFQQRRFESQHKEAMNQLEVRFNKELAAER